MALPGFLRVLKSYAIGLFTLAIWARKIAAKRRENRARRLAHAIGSYHIDLNFDGMIKAVTTLFFGLFGFQLRYKTQEHGSEQSGLALQNLQARLRMVLAYLLSSTLTIVRGRPGGGNLIVLSSSNSSEALRG